MNGSDVISLYTRKAHLHQHELRGIADLAESTLRVFVPYTTLELTRAALEAVAARCRNLNPRVVLLAVHVVPYPLPVDTPAVAKEHLVRQLVGLAHDAGLPAEVTVVLARDASLGYQQILLSKSLVVLATKKRWWRTREHRLARSLSQNGHSVALLTV